MNAEPAPTTQPATIAPPRGVATPTVACAGPGCDRTFHSKALRLKGGDVVPKRFCSGRCRIRAWDAANPRQKPLAFHVPTVELNATAPKERSQALASACFRALEALVEVDGREVYAPSLLPVAGSRYSARINELRHAIGRWTGREFVPLRKGEPARNNAIPVREDHRTGEAWFRLEPWALAACRDALAARVGRVA